MKTNLEILQAIVADHAPLYYPFTEGNGDIEVVQFNIEGYIAMKNKVFETEPRKFLERIIEAQDNPKSKMGWELIVFFLRCLGFNCYEIKSTESTESSLYLVVMDFDEESNEKIIGIKTTIVRT